MTKRNRWGQWSREKQPRPDPVKATLGKRAMKKEVLRRFHHSRNGVSERLQTLSRIQDPVSYMYLPGGIDNHSVKGHMKKLRPRGRPIEATGLNFSTQ